MLDVLRRAFGHLQARQIPEMDQRLRDAIAEVTEVVKANADLNAGLELSIPLIPLLLDYKVNLDLRQWWGKVARGCYEDEPICVTKDTFP